MADLKRCPFCGSRDVEPRPDNFAGVGCNVCLTIGPQAHTMDDAIAKWNERRLVTETQAECLQKAVDEVCLTISELPEEVKEILRRG